MANELVVSSEAQAYLPVMNIQVAVARRQAIVDFGKQVMVKDVDYGVIPGVKKPSLLKPGAEKLATLFGLAPQFIEIEATEDWTGAAHGGEPFFLYRYRCDLFRNGTLVGSGIGSCNSWESKYRYRNGERVCPECGEATLMRSKFPPKNQPKADPGWYCYAKKGGCGAEFNANDTRITEQVTGKVPNPDPADVVNTIDKMAQKRALVAATLIAVNASEFFTQDVEDMVVDGHYTVVLEKEALSGNGNGNGGGGDATTGIVKGTATPTAAAVPAGTEVWKTWKNPVEAQEWAKSTGAYGEGEKAVHASRGGFKKVASELFPGQDSCKAHQLPQLYQAYYEHVQAKIEIAKMQAAADVEFMDAAAGTDDNPFEDSK